MKLGKRMRTFWAAAIAVAALVVIPATSAAAATAVSGSLNVCCNLAQYPTQFYHYDGTMGIKLNTVSPSDFCGAPIAFGMRSVATGVQVTNSRNVWNTTTIHYWVRLSNGAQTIPTGRYALNARGQGGGCGYSTYNWTGTLYI